MIHLESTLQKMMEQGMKMPGAMCGQWGVCGAVTSVGAAVAIFPLTEETKITVINNMYCLFRNYLLCKEIEWIVFSYSFHGERGVMWEAVLQKLAKDEISFLLYPVILKCSWEENVFRARKDNRDEARIERGMKNTFSFYDDFEYPIINTTALSVKEVVDKVVERIRGFYGDIYIDKYVCEWISC